MARLGERLGGRLRLRDRLRRQDPRLAFSKLLDKELPSESFTVTNVPSSYSN